MNKKQSKYAGARRTVRATLLLSTVLALLVPAAPAQAGLLGGLIDIVDTTVDTATGLVVGENGLLSGWMYDDASTSMTHVNEVVGAPKMWRKGITGAGVQVAVLDTGSVPIRGLSYSPVVNGPDLSFESQ